jgi:hypothetical protein
MASSGFSNINTNGLVLYFDAANSKSYSGSATWSDLSSSANNATLVNSPTFVSTNAGSLLFDGISEYGHQIGQVSSYSFIQNTGIYTISAWVKPATLSTEMYICGNNAGTSAQKGIYFGTGGTGNCILALSRGVLNNFSLNHSVSSCFTSTSEWVNLVAVGNGTINKFWRNGVQFGSQASFSTLSTGDSSYALAVGIINNVTGSWRWSGNISSLQIYNRNLSDQEIISNYNSSKNRFI